MAELERRKEWGKLLIEGLGGRCWWCGHRENLELHHIIPLSKGGPDSVHNLSVLCSWCHRQAGGGAKPVNKRMQRYLLEAQTRYEKPAMAFGMRAPTPAWFKLREALET